MPPEFLFVINNQTRPNDEIIKLKFTEPGAQSRVLNVHRGVLSRNSSFFQNAMKPEWTVLRENPEVIELPDDFETVRHYIKYLYSGNVSIKLYNAGEDTPEDIAKEETQNVFIMLAKAYVFGEAIIDTKYKNAVMKTIITAMNSSVWFLGPECINIIYNGTPSASPLKRLIADQVAHFAYNDSEKAKYGWMDSFDDFSREALLEAIKAMVRVRPALFNISSSVNWYLEKEEVEVEER